MDAHQDLLHEMRLTGGVFLDAEFTAPWCVAAQVGPEDCAPYTPVPRHIIAYHYVIDGRLLLKVDGHPACEVAGGEIVVLPRNDRHIVGSTLRARPVRADDLIKPDPDGGLARIVHGGGGERTHIVCGFLGSDMPRSPVFALLPAVLKISVADGASASWIESSLRFASRELSEGRLKSPAILARLADLLFMEAVRRYLASRQADLSGWRAAASDPVVASALGLLHGQISRRWTTEDLAEALSLSRSAFAERFTRVVGVPPMRYLARQRLELSSVRLRESSDAIARIAYDVGYESEAAFSRAFKREYGIPPAAWRKGAGAS